jgi:hypothetical protein
MRYRGGMLDGAPEDWLTLIIALAFVAGVLALSRWLR